MLKSIRLKNFRSHYDTTIPLSSYTSIIGPNGSGKSNIVEAIKFCLTSYTTKNKELLKMIYKNSLQTQNITNTIVRLEFSRNNIISENDEVKETEIEDIQDTDKAIITQTEECYYKVTYTKRIKAIAQLDGFKLFLSFYKNNEEIKEEEYLNYLKEEGLTTSLIISQSSNFSFLLEKNILEHLKLNTKTTTHNLLSSINKLTKKLELRIKYEEIESLKAYLSSKNVYNKINTFRENSINKNRIKNLSVLLTKIEELNKKEAEIKLKLQEEEILLANKENILKNFSENSVDYIKTKIQDLKLKQELIKRETNELIREIKTNEGEEYLNIFQSDILNNPEDIKPNILFRMHFHSQSTPNNLMECYQKIKLEYKKLIDDFKFSKENELQDLEINVLPLKTQLLKEFDIQNSKYGKLKANYDFYNTKIKRIKTELEVLKEEHSNLTELYSQNTEHPHEESIHLNEIIEFLMKCNLINKDFKNDGSYKSMKILDDCMNSFEPSAISNYLETLKSIYTNKIFGRLISLIKFNSSYLKTINSSLNKYLDAIITDSQSTSYICLKYLKESVNSNSSVIFLNLSKDMQNKEMKTIKTPTGDILKPVIDLLTFKDEMFRPLFNDLLINTFYIENFSNIKHLSNQFIQKHSINRIIGIEGEVFYSNGLYTSHSFRPNTEIIEYFANSYKQLRIQQKKFEEFDIKISKIEEREGSLEEELNYYENIIFNPSYENKHLSCESSVSKTNIKNDGKDIINQHYENTTSLDNNPQTLTNNINKQLQSDLEINKQNKQMSELERQELILSKIKTEINNLNTDYILELKKTKKKEFKNYLNEFKKQYFPTYPETNNLELLFKDTSSYKIYLNKMVSLRNELKLINKQLEEQENHLKNMKEETIPKNELTNQINILIENTNKLKNKILGLREIKYQLLQKENIKEDELNGLIKKSTNKEEKEVKIYEILKSLIKEIDLRLFSKELQFISDLYNDCTSFLKYDMTNNKENPSKKKKLSINNNSTLISDTEKEENSKIIEVENILKNLIEIKDFSVLQRINISSLKDQIQSLLKDEFELIDTDEPMVLLNCIQEIQKELRKRKRTAFIERNRIITSFLGSLNEEVNRIYNPLKPQSFINLSINENNENPQLEIKVKIEEEGFMKIENLSGGEKDLIEWCLLFALSHIISGDCKQIIIVDELDKHLDTSNLSKLSDLLYNFSIHADSNLIQIINISHKPVVFSKSKCLIGCYSKQHINIRDRESWNDFYKEMRESYKSSDTTTTHVVRETKVISLNMN